MGRDSCAATVEKLVGANWVRPATAESKRRMDGQCSGHPLGQVSKDRFITERRIGKEKAPHHLAQLFWGSVGIVGTPTQKDSRHHLIDAVSEVQFYVGPVEKSSSAIASAAPAVSKLKCN